MPFFRSRSSFAVASALLVGVAAAPLACGSDDSGPGPATTSQAGEFRGTFVSKDGTTGVFELRNTGVARQAIRIRDTTTGAVTATLVGHVSAIYALVALPVDRIVGAATRLWEAPGLPRARHKNWQGSA